jgi:CubicO group peptidase (beta-lactamase class C family)
VPAPAQRRDLPDFEQQSDGVSVPLRFGIGFGLPQPDSVPYMSTGRICFWGGWGGSVILMDVGRRLTLSFMMNGMGPGTVGSARTEAYVRATDAALNVPTPGGRHGAL